MTHTSAELSSSLTLPDNSGGGLYSYSALLASISAAIAATYYSISHRDPLVLIAVPLSLAAAFLLYRSVTTSTPDTISVEGESIILTNVPSWSIWLEKAIVPLVISKRIEIRKADFHLEWLGQSLTWNDLQKGKSVHLANSDEAKTLLAWFNGHGITIPPLPL
jgi:hypothetical protein